MISPPLDFLFKSAGSARNIENLRPRRSSPKANGGGLDLSYILSQNLKIFKFPQIISSRTKLDITFIQIL